LFPDGWPMLFQIVGDSADGHPIDARATFIRIRLNANTTAGQLAQILGELWVGRADDLAIVERDNRSVFEPQFDRHRLYTPFIYALCGASALVEDERVYGRAGGEQTLPSSPTRSVWNFVGAGVFGFLINLPIVSYFEVGTTLTANHAYAAMFGVFGMLALAVLVFCLRAMQSDTSWKGTEKFVRMGFRGSNVGLALMIILDLFPGGVIQLWDSIANGY